MIELEHLSKLVPEVAEAECLPLEDVEASTLQLFSALEKDAYPFVLESSLYHPRFGRFSILGSEPFLILKSSNDKITLKNVRTGLNHEVTGNPLSVIDLILKRMALTLPGARVPFIGGGVGYFGYELGSFIEKLPAPAPADFPLPDMHMAFYDRAIVFDAALRRTYACAVRLKGESTSAHRKIERLMEKMQGASVWQDEHFTEVSTGNLESNFSKAQYLEAIRRTIDYIGAGDIFQANISQRFRTEMDIGDFELFRRLRTINPAPFSAFLRLDEGAVISSSPERFLRVRNGLVETRPIKGTRPRGKSPEEDEALAEQLLASEKDNAELAMIVDLERNDLGRVCSYGTVQVPEKRVLEKYPTVFHLVATVTGKLHEGKGTVDLLKATFPGGSITGAPKIRAMEIIRELEPTRRGVYTGALGYVGFNGDTDLNIVIRTFLKRGPSVTFQVGGGIIADSDPEAEYQETLDKARALVESLKGVKKEIGVRD
jgi:para-aminobenzoate synthetase component 1